MRVQVHHQRHPGKKIFSLDTYVVYSLGTISTNHVCPKAKTISEVQIKSGQTIKLYCGCYIQTMDHIIMANETEDMEVHSKWLNWTWTLRELFQQPENKIVTKAIKKIWAKISGKFDADTLLRELNMLVKNTTPQPLGVHLARHQDCWSNDHPLGQTVLLEEVLPISTDTAIPSAICTSGSTGVQHEPGSNLPLKTLKDKALDEDFSMNLVQ